MNEQKEIKITKLMIELYCKKNHKTKGKNLCINCGELLDYVKFRRAKCPYGDDKPFCSNCKIHCYKADLRFKIKQVMRFSGPRLIFRHPIISFNHLIQSKKQNKRKQLKETR